MHTKFTKIDKTDFSNWVLWFHAGDAWLNSLEILRDNRDRIFWGVFYVTPSVVAFCLELFVKSLAAHVDNLFVGKDYPHNTTAIIEKYASSIPVFNKIKTDKHLIKIIKEYEKTKDTRFGETYVSLNGDDQMKLISLIYELRSEICKRTGLH